MLGHAYEAQMMAATFNLQDFFHDFISKYSLSFIKSATLAVDAFFFISGFFAALTFLSAFENAKFRSWRTVLSAYLHRYLRLFPMLWLSAMLLIFIAPTVKDEPFNPYVYRQIDNCHSSWMQTFLYVNNFQKFSNTCMDWTWYLMNDMQFFLVAPFLVLPFAYSFSIGLLVLGLTAVASIVVTSIVFSYYELHSSFVKPSEHDYYTIYYAKPYCRILPYLLGILFLVLYRQQKRPEVSRLGNCFAALAEWVRTRPWSSWLLYALGLTLMWVMVSAIHFFDNHPDDWGQALSTFYEVSFRPLFVLGLMCILYPTLFGKDQLLLSILGHSIFAPLAKVTYGVYLIHIILNYFLFSSNLYGVYTSTSYVWFSFCTAVYLGFLVSFVGSFLFEAPVLQLLKTYLEPSRKPPPMLVVPPSSESHSYEFTSYSIHS